MRAAAHQRNCWIVSGCQVMSGELHNMNFQPKKSRPSGAKCSQTVRALMSPVNFVEYYFNDSCLWACEMPAWCPNIGAFKRRTLICTLNNKGYDAMSSAMTPIGHLRTIEKTTRKSSRINDHPKHGVIPTQLVVTKSHQNHIKKPLDGGMCVLSCLKFQTSQAVVTLLLDEYRNQNDAWATRTLLQEWPIARMTDIHKHARYTPDFLQAAAVTATRIRLSQPATHDLMTQQW